MAMVWRVERGADVRRQIITMSTDGMTTWSRCTIPALAMVLDKRGLQHRTANAR